MAEGSGVQGGCIAQRCCPSAGWEIPSCPSSIPLLLALPRQGLLAVPSLGLARIRVVCPPLSPPDPSSVAPLALP